MSEIITCQTSIYAFSKDNEPVKRVKTGETVTIETYDCFQNQITSEETTFNAIDWNQINPATGPIYVEGAEPGDILKVKIEQLEIGGQGVMSTGEGLGVMGHRLDGFQIKIVPIKDNKAIFDEKLHIPLNPMIGVIGVAPAGESVSCGTPGAHGGNLDTKMIAEGATVYFPVFTDGALFATGDFHAAMGDGEVCVSGVEVPGKVTVTFEVIKGHTLKHPMVENEEGVALLVSAETLDEAVKKSVEDMIDLLQPQTGLTLGEMTMLMSAVGQTQISQVVDPLVTARFFVPRTVLTAYGISLFE